MTATCPITNLEKVLLATDGSAFSAGASREAIGLAKKCGSHLVAMAVIETNPEYSALAPELLEKEEQRVRDVLDAVKNDATTAGVDVETTAHEGEHAWQYIIEEAGRQRAEMIIMGRRGRTGLARVAMGSQTARVIGHAPCDVLVVPRDASVKCENILVATDGSSFSEAAAREAIAMAAKCSARLSVISVASSEAEMPAAEGNVDNVSEQAAAAGVSVEKQTAVGKAYLEIVKSAEQMKADMIVVGCHGRTGLKKLLMGSVAERVVGHASSAVLVACS